MAIKVLTSTGPDSPRGRRHLRGQPRRRAVLLQLSLISVAALFANAAAAGPPAPARFQHRLVEYTEKRQPCARSNPLRSPYFGDLHVHTALSLDASTQGTVNGPRDAYRFAQGEELGIQPYEREGKPGRVLKLSRPLDFAAVTDHAELFGELTICRTPGFPGHDSMVCRLFRRWPRLAFYLMNHRATTSTSPRRFEFCGPGGKFCRSAALGPWTEAQDAAEGAYDRSEACRFTSFVGYEWSGSPGTRNIHRNVIFRNAVVPEYATSYVDAPRPELLWESLQRDCLDAGTGCDVLTIPHNSNLSGESMFPTESSGGGPMTAGYARRRAAMEPLVEIMQHKGDSECRYGTGTVDELCNFEQLPYDRLAGNFVPWIGGKPGPMNFVRNALKYGLLQELRIGVNPYRFGFVASTDTHLGTPGAVDERNHPGHGGAGLPASKEMPPGLPDDIEFNPGGLVVIWAEENSRDSLFAALKRREVYGTSGPRVVMRFFGGWNLPDDMCSSHGFASVGYARGVPMGGRLGRRPSDLSRGPQFAVWALADPGTVDGPGTDLQRVQIIKGWVGQDATYETVYDVAGKPDGAAGVDTASCRPYGRGARSLCAVWRDPDFDPEAPAFYYARVLENPTCRWSTFVCNAHRVDCAEPATIGEGLDDCCNENFPRTVQERAWSSPIWYSTRDTTELATGASARE